MADQPPSPTEGRLWQVTGDAARELMRVHREQVAAYDEVPPDPPADSVRTTTREARALDLDDLAADVRALVERYEQTHPGVRIKPLRYIEIGGDDGATVVGEAELPAEGLVTLALTATVADDERAEVTSRMLVAEATASEAS
jgi:hypothetical protein